MPTDYVHTLTAFCPESLFPVGNTLAYLFGESGEGNLLTFRTVRYTKDGIGYAIEPAQCRAGLAGVIQGLAQGSIPPLPDPWPEGLPVSRNECLSALEAATVILEFDLENPPAYEGGLVFALDVDWRGLAQAMGFELIPDE